MQKTQEKLRQQSEYVPVKSDVLDKIVYILLNSSLYVLHDVSFPFTVSFNLVLHHVSSLLQCLVSCLVLYFFISRFPPSMSHFIYRYMPISLSMSPSMSYSMSRSLYCFISPSMSSSLYFIIYLLLCLVPYLSLCLVTCLKVSFCVLISILFSMQL